MICKVHFNENLQSLEFPLDSICFHFSFMSMIPLALNLLFWGWLSPKFGDDLTCTLIQKNKEATKALLELLKGKATLKRNSLKTENS